MVFRDKITRLEAWLSSSDRRPLVLRGARQVGKTWLVRELAARSDLDLVELNFERDPSHVRAFSSNDPREVIGELSLRIGRAITPGRSLLFLDEIQAAGSVLAQLRWFYEELPELAVVAAGSLLEFTLADHAFSMPVGRVSFEHVEPMSFREVLLAHDQRLLLDALTAWRPGRPLSVAAHESATSWFERYAMVGGMPAVVAADVAGQPPRHCRSLQADLVAAYRADFAKYSGRMDRALLDHVLLAVARALGSKFVYARVGEGVKQHQAKKALERLAQARLCHVIPHTSANGLPLAAEVKDRLRKVVLADVGLLHGLLSTPATDAFPRLDALSPPLRGQLAEQLVAQQLRGCVDDRGDGAELYYWQREGGRPGEIDYVVQLGARIVPIEIKAGATGAMKSLHQFMHDKRLSLAVRVDGNPPSVLEVDVMTTQSQRAHYELLSVPSYLAWNIAAIVGDR